MTLMMPAGRFLSRTVPSGYTFKLETTELDEERTQAVEVKKRKQKWKTLKLYYVLKCYKQRG